MPKPILGFLIKPSFQAVNGLFVLSFENKGNMTVSTKDYLTTVEMKDYNFMIGGQNFFWSTSSTWFKNIW